MTPSRLLPLLALGALLSADAAAARRNDPAPPPSVSAAVEAGAADRAEGIRLLEALLASNPDPESEPWAMAWVGEQRRLGGDSALARTWFERVAERFPTHPAKEAAVLGMALVDAQSTLSGNTLATLQLIGDHNVPDSMNADRYRLLARVAADEGSPAGKVRDLVRKAVEHAEGDPSVAARVQATLGDLVEQPADFEGVSIPTADAEAVALTRIRAALHARDFSGAQEQIARFRSVWPDSPDLAEVGWLEKRAAARDPVTAGRVCGLLPLTGEYAPPGKRIQVAIQEANTSLGSPMDLRFHDTAGDPDKAVAALETAALKDGCTVVLGPLTKGELEPVAAAAEALEIPLVTLSQSADQLEDTPWVFLGFLTLQQQVDALLDEVMGVRGLQAFAVVYPDNPYGQQARDLFASGVERRGGQVVRVAPYPPDAPEFLGVARSLGQKDDKERSGELYRLRRDAERAGKDPDKVMLPPIINFEAIFIPDNYRRVGLVASALAYEEFPLGAFKPHRDVVPLPLLGLNGWNNEEIVQAGGSFVRKSLFVDAFLASAPESASFVSAWKDATGQPPIVLDAVVYDTARLVGMAARKGGGDRAAVRDALTEVTLDNPTAGGRSFGVNHEVHRRLLVLTVGRDAIEPAPPPEPLELPDDGTPPSP